MQPRRLEPSGYLDSGARPPAYSRWHTDELPFRPLHPDEATFGQSRTYADYWRLALRYKGIILLLAFLGMLAALLLTTPQTPIYQARTSLEIQNVNENFLNLRDLNPNAIGSSYSSADYDLQTQIRMLQGREIRRRVMANHEDLAKRLIATRRSGRLFLWRKTLGLATEKPGTDLEEAVTEAGLAMSVRQQPNSRLLNLTVDSSDPRLAAELANTISTEFIEMSLDKRWKTIQHTTEWLAHQMEDLKIKLERTQGELQAYARAHQLVFTSEKDNVAEDRLRRLQEELSKAQSERIAKQSRYEAIAAGNNEALPEVQDDPSLRELQTELSGLRRQLAEVAASYTPAHVKYTKVQAQIVTVQSAMDKRLASILTRLKSDYASSRRREELLAADFSSQTRLMASQADKVGHYNILKRELDTTQQLYDSMLQRVKESGIASALRASNIHVIEAAEPPQQPYKPVLAYNLGLGLAGGLAAAAALVLVRNRADRRIQAPGEIGLYLNVSELGVIPSDRDGARRSRRERAKLSVSTATAGRLELATLERRYSGIAEAYRVTLTSILFSAQQGAHPRVLVLSSPSKGEGKTTVLSNIAIALAQAGQRVLLIDGDMRNPRMHDIFEIENTAGLSEVLAAKTPLVVRETKVPNLFLLPAGSSNDGNLLFQPGLSEMLNRVRKEFDMVLIDTPPLLPMPDARVLGRQADATILVIRASSTSRDAARLACARLAEDGVPILGAVLTDWNAKTAVAYGYDAG